MRHGLPKRATRGDRLYGMLDSLFVLNGYGVTGSSRLCGWCSDLLQMRATLADVVSLSHFDRRSIKYELLERVLPFYFLLKITNGRNLVRIQLTPDGTLVN
jgi:hypothetical protein